MKHDYECIAPGKVYFWVCRVCGKQRSYPSAPDNSDCPGERDRAVRRKVLEEAAVAYDYAEQGAMSRGYDPPDPVQFLRDLAAKDRS